MINTKTQTISEVILHQEQSGFWKARSCIDKVFTLKQIIQKRREFNLDSHLH